MKYEQQAYYILNKVPQTCNEIETINDGLIFKSNQCSLTNSIIKADIYACLSYDKRKIITFITKGTISKVIILLFSSSDEYYDTLELIKAQLLVSPQDSKLISYARSISEKLQSGIEVSVFDAVKEDNFVICPACGVRNAKNSNFPFCLECGEPF